METKVFLILGAIGITIGAASAAAAEKFPAHQASIERWGGDALVAGFALLGLSFPLV